MPEPEGKKKRGRPKKEDQATAELKPVLAGLTAGVFDLLAARLGPWWKLDRTEVDAIVDPACRILERLSLSEQAGKYGDWLALAVAVTVVTVPRVSLTAQAREERRKNRGDKSEPERTPAPSGGPGSGERSNIAPLRGGGDVKTALPGLA